MNNARILDLLNEVAEFLDGYSDVVDGSYGEPHPNQAMSLLLAVECEIENLKSAAPQPSTATVSTGSSQDGLGQGDAAVAAPSRDATNCLPKREK